MDIEQINELKKIKSSLSCTLSTIRREIKNPLLSKKQLENKINRGLKIARQHQEIIEKLIAFGVKSDPKAQHMFPKWWEKMLNDNEFKQRQTSNIQMENIVAEISPHFCEQINITKSLNELFDKTKSEFDKLFNGEENEYLLNFIWTENKCPQLSYLLHTIENYMKYMGARLDSTELCANEHTHIYKYFGRDFCTLKRTIQFIIDEFGGDTDMAFFGKYCRKD